MTGAIEFLRKAKAIHKAEGFGFQTLFDIVECIGDMENALTESDLVRKVMDYRLEDKDEKDT